MRVEPTAVDSRMGAVMPGRRLPPGTALAADPADAQGETTGLLPVFLPGRRSPDRDIFCPDVVEQHASPARRRSPGRVIDGSGQCCWPRRSWSCTCPGYRSGPRRDTCTVVVQMDASMADAALDVEDPPGAGEESGMRKLSADFH